MTRIRTAVLSLVAIVGLAFAPLVVAGSASAVTGVTVLFFSNPDYTDQEEEDATMIAALEAGGAIVTTFDGGDGSDRAWDTALVGNRVLVIPESNDPVYEPGGTPVISDAAAGIIRGFAEAGGTIFLGAAGNPEVLSFVTGLDYTSVWNYDGTSGPWSLAASIPTLPPEVTYSNGTYATAGVSTWPTELQDALIPLYVGIGDEFAAAGFGAGEGGVITLAYDWYPGQDPEDIAGRDLWNLVLNTLAEGTAYVSVLPAPAPAPAPQLADTGASFNALPWALAAALLLAGFGAVAATRIRSAKN